MTQATPEREKPPVARTTGGQSKTVEAIDTRFICEWEIDGKRILPLMQSAISLGAIAP